MKSLKNNLLALLILLTTSASFAGNKSVESLDSFPQLATFHQDGSIIDVYRY